MRKVIISFIFILLAFAVKAQNTGLATYYGKKFNNRKTASGERYRKDSMVCAHKTYPFSTMLRVKSLVNGNEVIVRVIDRGPFRKKCIIDLSYAAAKELDMLHQGLIKVEISEYNNKENINRSDSLNVTKITRAK
ncbi:septal ring lytic transglycosylase RlpA family protein [Dysgonomonas sp. 521]|uniref:septal ring lytic transglycosylase RlpA family protein n=1 Tax=Dysgonomonas sp. 521 TaxID=2302932 RepID=UPI0013D8B309|nr:septal ring lytic transglycosylase RlpA family protein [Dysgonomonas sp. 521]NDV97486.1 septal ring lytic transglycosylase RlpA family protein [Dysgonomonas sp. 521]